MASNYFNLYETFCMRFFYKIGGAELVQAALPHRSRQAIYNKAWSMGYIRTNHGRRQLNWSKQEKELLIDIVTRQKKYRGKVHYDLVSLSMEKNGFRRSRSACKSMAQFLGLQRTSFASPNRKNQGAHAVTSANEN